MAFRTLEKGASEVSGMYPRFEEIGDYAEGNLLEIGTDDYGNKRIVLWKGNDEETGEAITQMLPSNADLRKYYSQLEVGDYVRVELSKIIKSNDENYADKKIYKVQVDDERAVEFGDEEE